MPTDLPKQAAEIVNQLVESVQRKLDTWCAVRTPDGFRAVELEVSALMRQVGDKVTSMVLDTILGDISFQARACAAAMQQPAEKLRRSGVRGGRELAGRKCSPSFSAIEK